MKTCPKSLQVPIIARSNQRGAAVFVVMMAIVVLTGVGVWAVHLAGLTDAASGYNRAAAQTLYTSELGVIAGTAYLSIPGFADANYAQADLDQANGTADSCWSVEAGEFCKSMPMVDIDTTIEEETADFDTARKILDLSSAEGSLGPVANVLEGNFILEMTEPRTALIEGMEAGDRSYQIVTLTSYGLVRPRHANFCTDAGSQNALASRMAMRAHMVVGPLMSQAGASR